MLVRNRKSRSRFFRSRRALRRMSQIDLADAIGYSAVRLSHFETGKANPPLEVAEQICKMLEAPMAELFPDLAEQSPPSRRGELKGNRRNLNQRGLDNEKE